MIEHCLKINIDAIQFFYSILQSRVILFAVAFCSPLLIYAQQDSVSAKEMPHDSLIQEVQKEIDMIDILRIIDHKSIREKDGGEGKKIGNIYLSILPAVGYSTFTGWAGAISCNAAFYTDKSVLSKISTITSNPTITQYNQLALPLQTNIWTSQNKFNIVTDWRYLHTPQNTYGLGSKTTDNDKFGVDFHYLRLFSTVFRRIYKDHFLGLGYNYEYFWNVTSDHSSSLDVTRFQTFFDRRYTPVQQTSGISFNYLYDSRTNRINSKRGTYIKFVYNPNLIIFWKQ